MGSNYTIKIRLRIFSSIFLAIILGISLFCWHAIQSLDQSNTAATDKSDLITQSLLSADNAQLAFKNQIQAWKNTLLRGSDPATLEKYREEFKKAGDKTQQELATTGNLLKQLKLSTPLLGEAQTAHAELGSNYLNALKQFDGSNPAAIDQAVKGMDRAPAKKMDEITAYIAAQAKLSHQASLGSSQTQFQSLQLFLIAAGVFSLAAGLLSSLWLTRSILQPLALAEQSITQIAAGNLGSAIPKTGQDEIAHMLQVVEALRHNFVDIVRDMRTGAETIASESAQIATDSLELSGRTEQQCLARNRVSHG